RDATDITSNAFYRSSNESIATVGPDGMLRALSPGTAMIGIVYAGRITTMVVTISENPDRDGDQIPNIWESAHGLNPDDPADATMDQDHDGLTTFEEYRIGTEWDVADTDSDTLVDGRELAIGTNPLLFDTDGDGVGDGIDICPLA